MPLGEPKLPEVDFQFEDVSTATPDDPEYPRHQKILELMKKIESGEITEDRATFLLQLFDRDSQTVSDQT